MAVGLFADLLEVLLHVLLENHRNFITADVAARVAVGGAVLRVAGAKLLLAGRHLDRSPISA